MGRACYLCLRRSIPSKIYNLLSCPSVVETTSKKRNKQQNPRIAGSQCVLLSTPQLAQVGIQHIRCPSLAPIPLPFTGKCARAGNETRQYLGTGLYRNAHVLRPRGGVKPLPSVVAAMSRFFATGDTDTESSEESSEEEQKPVPQKIVR